MVVMNTTAATSNVTCSHTTLCSVTSIGPQVCLGVELQLLYNVGVVSAVLKIVAVECHRLGCL